MSNIAKYELPWTWERKLFHIPVQTVKIAVKRQAGISNNKYKSPSSGFNSVFIDLSWENWKIKHFWVTRPRQPSQSQSEGLMNTDGSWCQERQSLAGWDAVPPPGTWGSNYQTQPLAPLHQSLLTQLIHLFSNNYTGTGAWMNEKSWENPSVYSQHVIVKAMLVEISSNYISPFVVFLETFV